MCSAFFIVKLFVYKRHLRLVLLKTILLMQLSKALLVVAVQVIIGFPNLETMRRRYAESLPSKNCLFRQDDTVSVTTITSKRAF